MSEQVTERTAWSIDEVASTLGVSRDLVNDAIRDGKLRSIKIGRRRIIPADAFAEFLKTAS